MADCVRQLSEASSAVSALNEDLVRRSDSSARFNEQLAQTLARALSAEQRERQVSVRVSLPPLCASRIARRSSLTVCQRPMSTLYTHMCEYIVQ